MGLGFGDLDCDGRLDLFASNLGDYGFGSLGAEVPLGNSATRWFLGRGDGTFTDPGVGEINATPFAWGNAVFDYDNDGDLDLLSHGGLDISFLTLADNPGTIYQNQGCSGQFRLDSAAIPQDPTCTDTHGTPIPGCTAHIRRNVRGLAVGDLDRNGFADVVTRVNRDGIGAVLSVTPKGGSTVTLPVVAGSSHLSQHALEKVFGLATARRATVEVLWPGGVRNRFHGARSGEQVVMPEIPCSFDGHWSSAAEYLACVRPALRAHHRSGTIDARQRARHLASALYAFREHRRIQ